MTYAPRSSKINREHLAYAHLPESVADKKHGNLFLLEEAESIRRINVPARFGKGQGAK